MRQPFISFLTLCTLVLVILGCSPTESPDLSPTEPLPTLAQLAQVATPTQTPSPESGVPPTFTPAVREGETVPTILPTRAGTTRTPTPVVTIPTRTPSPEPPTATPTVTHTPTRISVIDQLALLPPSTELGPSKLGIHVIQNNDPRIMAFVRDSKPALVKSVDDLGFLEEVKEVSPTTITVGRVNDLEAQNYAGDPQEAAREYVRRNLEKYLANPGVDYWEGWNEPDPNIEHMGWYAQYEAERVRVMAQYGLKSAIGGFATGVPEMDEFKLFIPAIQAAKEHNGILSLHEYGAPDMTYLYGGALPGYPSYPDRGALNFRYRWYYREILEPADLVIPLAITEAGVDGIIGNRPGPSGRGWTDFQSYWVEQGIGANGTEAFINQLAWYDNGVRQDGYVIGFAVFTAGDVDIWGSYEIDSILPDLANYVNSQR